LKSLQMHVWGFPMDSLIPYLTPTIAQQGDRYVLRHGRTPATFVRRLSLGITLFETLNGRAPSESVEGEHFSTREDWEVPGSHGKHNLPCSVRWSLRTLISGFLLPKPRRIGTEGGSRGHREVLSRTAVRSYLVARFTDPPLAHIGISDRSFNYKQSRLLGSLSIHCLHSQPWGEQQK